MGQLIDLADRSFNVATTTRAKIVGLQGVMEKMPQADAKLTHHFAPQVYGREMAIDADTLVVGKIHKHAHLNILLAGEVYVSTEFGRERVVAPEVWISEPGVKRAIYAVKDSRWMTVHPNADDGHDLGVIENYVIAPSFEAYDKFSEGRL